MTADLAAWARRTYASALRTRPERLTAPASTCDHGRVSAEVSRPAQERMLRWLDEAQERITALRDRVDAGEEVTDDEAREILGDVLAGLATAIDSDRGTALLERMQAGEEVDDAEAREVLREAIVKID